MPTLSSISLNDGASTPVAHAFTPINISGDVATFKERLIAGFPSGYPQLTVSLREPAKVGGNYKAVIKLHVPKAVTTTGSDGKTVTSIDYSHLGSIELVLPDRGLAAERKDLTALLANALNNADVKKVIHDLEHFY